MPQCNKDYNVEKSRFVKHLEKASAYGKQRNI